MSSFWNFFWTTWYEAMFLSLCLVSTCTFLYDGNYSRCFPILRLSLIPKGRFISIHSDPYYNGHTRFYSLPKLTVVSILELSSILFESVSWLCNGSSGRHLSLSHRLQFDHLLWGLMYTQFIAWTDILFMRYTEVLRSYFINSFMLPCYNPLFLLLLSCIPGVILGISSQSLFLT